MESGNKIYIESVHVIGRYRNVAAFTMPIKFWMGYSFFRFSYPKQRLINESQGCFLFLPASGEDAG